MASPSELSLECKPLNNSSYSLLLKSFNNNNAAAINGDHHHDHIAGQKLEDILSRLEEERVKIDAFKRELPLCMQLLSNAVEASRQQLQAYKSSSANQNQGQLITKPVLEEFIPIKQSSNSDQTTSDDQKLSNNISDKATWMTSAQLWSQAGSCAVPPPPSQSSKELSLSSCSPKLALDNNITTKPRNGGAFTPFSKSSSQNNSSTLLALASSAADQKDLYRDDHHDYDSTHEEKKLLLCGDNAISCLKRVEGNNNGGLIVVKSNNDQQGLMKGSEGINSPLALEGSQAITSFDGNNNNNNNHNNGNGNSTSQTHRKARRCWSPDLHRRFVNALQMLGGSQVATPKQIRELMKVDGLTNDEVKSHLQKYRLHTRRPSPNPQPAGAPAPQLVVLGGIWVPPEYATAAAAAAAHNGGGPTLYGPHPTSHVQPHYCSPAVAQDFYASNPQLHHHHHAAAAAAAMHHQLHVYNANSQNPSSPESDLRGNGDRSESIEDGKSTESNSWKVESGENGGGRERKSLVALRQDGGGNQWE